jgi:hypothetical protein
VAKGHAQQRAHQRTLAEKQLCSQREPSPYHVKTSNPGQWASFLSQTLPVYRNFSASWCLLVLFGKSLSDYVLLNASRTATIDFDAK